MSPAKAAKALTRRLVYVEERLKLRRDRDQTLAYLATERDALYRALVALGATVPAEPVQAQRDGARRAVSRVGSGTCERPCPVHGRKPEAAE